MKLSDVKERIDAYFDSVSPSEIINRLEVLGFEFTPHFDDNSNVKVIRTADDVVPGFFERSGKQDILIDASLFAGDESFIVTNGAGETQGGIPSYAMAA
jgi:hypothetical protein